MTPRDAFADQARSCSIMGSSLTAEICMILGESLDRDHRPVARRILDWPGEPSSRCDSVPLRLAGALHALVLDRSAPQLAAAYADGHVSAKPLLAAITAYEARVMRCLDYPPQTNEVGRSAILIAAARFAQALCPLPIAALELGASAGLNLNFGHYHLLESGKGVALHPDWRGELPSGA